MKFQSSSHTPFFLGRFVNAASVIVAGIGLIVIAGWFLNIQSFKSFLPGLQAMRFNTALCLLLLGSALGLLHYEHASRTKKYTGKFLAGLALLVSLLTMSEYLFQWNLGIDELIVQDPDSPPELFPGRMSPIATLSASFASVALLMLGSRISRLFSVVVAVLSFAVLMNYLFDHQLAFSGTGHTYTAGHSGAAFLILSLAVLVMRPSQGMAEALSSNLSGSKAVRLLLPGMILLTIFMGWLVEWAERVEILDASQEAIFLVIFLIVLYSPFIYFIGKSINRAEEAYRASERRYRGLVENFPNGSVTIFDKDLRLRFAEGLELRSLGLSPEEFVGKHFSEITPPETWNTAKPYIRAAFDEGKISSFETPYWDNRFYIFSIAPVRDSDGTINEIYIVTQNITQRKNAELALQESEARLKSSQRIAHIGHWSWETQSNRVVPSEELYRMFGVDPEQAADDLNDVIMKNVHPDDRQSVLDAYTTAVTESNSQSIEFRAVMPDGSVRYMLALPGDKITNEAGNLIKLTGIVQDITERKKAEEKISRLYERFNLAASAAHLGVWDWDIKNNALTWDEQTYALYGIKREDFGGTYEAWVNGLHPEDRARINEAVHKAMHDDGTFDTEYRVLWPDGTVRYVKGVGQVFFGEDGAPFRMLGVNYDVTSRKQAEEKIQKQIAYLTALRDIDRAITGTFDLKSSLDILADHSLNLLTADAVSVMLLNPDTESLTYSVGAGFRTKAFEQGKPLKLGEGYAGLAALRQTVVRVDSLASKTDNPRLAQHLEVEGFVQYFGVPLIAKGKVKGVLEIFLRESREPEREWFDFLETLAGQAAIAIDNAQLWEQVQKHTNELEQRVAQRTTELNQTNIELGHANRAKDEFLANMSHELRSPLNSILGLSETLLEQRRDALSAYQQKSLSVIESSGRHLLSLINDILDISKIEAGKFDYYPEWIGLEEMCQASLNFVKSQAIKKSINLLYEMDAVPSKILADPRRLKQTLVNLLTNAVKFTPAHGKITLRVHADAETEVIQFSVVDTGIGIAEEDLKRLFQPFTQVDSKLNRQYEGTGLGLMLVQKLTDLHGGSVHVESKLGKGSNFTINLPWVKEEIVNEETREPDHASPAKQRYETSVVMPESQVERGTILLAEDNLANILTISEYLESYDYRVIVAHDGAEAVEKAREFSPHVILMDIQMPAMDGLEAMQNLRSDARFVSTPIIALTALAMPGDRERCLAAGANEYMSKPVSLKNLSKTVSELLTQQEAR